MKVLERPVTLVEKAKDMQTVATNISVVLKTLQNVFNNSNFYKEARIVSFIDRLLDCVKDKFRKHLTFGKAIQAGQKDCENFRFEVTEMAKTAIEKFKENFFVVEWLKPKTEFFEETKDPFQQSFYRNEGLDFLYFQRPGTAYGKESFQREAGMGN